MLWFEIACANGLLNECGSWTAYLQSWWKASTVGADTSGAGTSSAASQWNNNATYTLPTGLRELSGVPSLRHSTRTLRTLFEAAIVCRQFNCTLPSLATLLIGSSTNRKPKKRPSESISSSYNTACWPLQHYSPQHTEAKTKAIILKGNLKGKPLWNRKKPKVVPASPFTRLRPNLCQKSLFVAYGESKSHIKTHNTHF